MKKHFYHYHHYYSMQNRTCTWGYHKTTAPRFLFAFFQKNFKTIVFFLKTRGSDTIDWDRSAELCSSCSCRSSICFATTCTRSWSGIKSINSSSAASIVFMAIATFITGIVLRIVFSESFSNHLIDSSFDFRCEVACFRFLRFRIAWTVIIIRWRFRVRRFGWGVWRTRCWTRCAITSP